MLFFDVVSRHVTRFWHHVKTISHCGHDDFEQLKFKDFQNPLMLNSKTFKTQFGFQELSMAWKRRKILFQELSRTCCHSVDKLLRRTFLFAVHTV